MILRYVGGKRTIAKKIIPHFPKHSRYISFNFGGGGLFFNKKPAAKYNFLNDIDNNIHNLFTVILTKKKEFEKILKTIPYHQGTWDWIKENDFGDDVMKAIKFIYIQNFGFLGLDGTLKIESRTAHKTAVNRIEKTYQFLNKCNCKFIKRDFRDVLKNISIEDKSKFFIYSDPPYLDTSKSISYQKEWNLQDTKDNLDIAVNCGINMAISEFDNPKIIKLAEERKLNIIPITLRRNLDKNRTEILITNYKLNNTLF